MSEFDSGDDPMRTLLDELSQTRIGRAQQGAVADFDIWTPRHMNPEPEPEPEPVAEPEQDIDEGATAQSKEKTIARYETLDEVAVRRGFDMSSDLVNNLPAGKVIKVVEERLNEEGTMRVRSKHGWMSVQAKSGRVLMAEVTKSRKAEMDRMSTRSRSASDVFEALSQSVADSEAIIDDPHVTAAAAHALLSTALAKAIADEEIPAGTLVNVNGYGIGTYTRFEKKRFGPGKHWIEFDQVPRLEDRLDQRVEKGREGALVAIDLKRFKSWKIEYTRVRNELIARGVLVAR
jgi:hypothetical protein